MPPALITKSANLPWPSRTGTWPCHCLAYLWRDEALRGQEEGRKDRPCVIILSVETEGGRTVVTMAPITHAPPAYPESAVEIPAATKQRRGLDGERSWVIATDLNRFCLSGR